jgi:hypothetical protein
MPTLANINGASLVQDPTSFSRGLGQGAQLGNLMRGNRLEDEALAQQQSNQKAIQGLTGEAMAGNNEALLKIAQYGEDGIGVANTIQGILQRGDKVAATKLSAGLKEVGAFAGSMMGKPAVVQRQALLSRAQEKRNSGDEERAAELIDMANWAGTDPERLQSELQQTVAISGLGKDQLAVFGMGGDTSPLDKAKTGKLVSETKLLDQKFKALGNSVTPTEDKVKIEKDLRQEVFNRSKDFEKVDDAWARVEVSAKDPSAAGDMAMIFNYMKMLDPGSTVREGEFATAQNAGGIDDKSIGLYNSIINGQRLSDSQRADFSKRAKSLYGVAKKKQDGLTKKYRGLAKRYGVDYENVILRSNADISDEDLVNKYL